jgi:hypothetical protein
MSSVKKSEDIRIRRSHGFFNMIREDVSNTTLDYSKLDNVSDQIVSVNVDNVVSEVEFYKCFLNIKVNLSKAIYKEDDTKKLTDVTIEYMATIMSKSMDYSMPSHAKNNVQADLAAELGKTTKSAYSAINRLKKGGYLVISEDGLIVPNAEYQNLRKVVKAHLNSGRLFPISYVLNFIVG